MELDNSTLIVFVSVVALIVAILYNASMIKQSTKSQYYQILKDLDTRFHKIQDNTNDGKGYRMHTANLGQFIHRLVDSKIIPKKYVLEPFRFVFAEGLWVVNHVPEGVEKSYGFIKFCKENGIQESKPPEWTYLEK